MTDREVLAQYERDFNEVRERKLNHAEKVTMKNARKANKFPYADDFHCKLQNGNDYHIIVIFYDKHQLKKRKVCAVIGSIIETERGKMYMQFMYNELGELQIVWFTAHFFRRFAERIGLEENLPLEKLIRIFFIKNTETCHEMKVTEYKGEKRLMFCFKDGVGMAQYKNGKNVMMTFLPNNYLNGKQSQRRDILEPERQNVERELQYLMQAKSWRRIYRL